MWLRKEPVHRSGDGSRRKVYSIRLQVCMHKINVGLTGQDFTGGV